MRKESGRSLAVVCLVVAMALWGSSFIALKVAFAELPALWVIFARMAIASIAFLATWRWHGRLDYRAGDWKYLLALAVCEPCLYFVFEAYALQNTSAAQAGMITALLPLLVAVGAFALLNERITRTTLCGFVVALCGVAWLTIGAQADEHAPAPLLGNILEVLAMLTAMGYTLILKYLSARYSAFVLTAMQAFVGTLFFLPLAAQSAPLPATISAGGLAAVAYLGLVVTVGAYGLYNFAVGRLPASQASAFINLIPLFTLLFAALVLGETLGGQQLAGAALVFVGVALSQWRRAVAPAVA